MTLYLHCITGWVWLNQQLSSLWDQGKHPAMLIFLGWESFLFVPCRNRQFEDGSQLH